MEPWFRSFLLGLLLVTPSAFSQQTSSTRATPPMVIEPKVERRDINEADIDTEDFEIGVFFGSISIEDFSNSSLTGLRLTYHLTESVFTEASYGVAEGGQTSYEILSGGAPFLTDEEREYSYYDLSLGYRFSGETFITQNWVFNSDFYLQAGAGNTEFGGDDRMTVTIGAGYRLLLTDWLVLRFDGKDQIFDSEIIGPKKTTHNLAFSLGLSVFF
ncbi:outer membrane beta-barrel domain-containing protein [Paraglaciecola sp. L3A3]|uniref:outer membrane beta-barrel domain-containing protein n=1 Tax=Paraglaciecola sp. L3A3 TaxID=2686358 RepID=UPI00131C8992|nr:outer membrane beta-barrel domain-containing protein [Paraglaciecola sp. L3A3]